MTTTSEIYAAINPLPAMLAAKGKERVEVDVRIEANAGFSVTFRWKKFGTYADWENEYNCFLGDSFEQALTKATDFIKEMPSAEQSKLNHFMGKLGKLIDAGKDEGIAVDYLNPLLATMKRLSENVISYKPSRAR